MNGVDWQYVGFLGSKNKKKKDKPKGKSNAQIVWGAVDLYCVLGNALN